MTMRLHDCIIENLPAQAYHSDDAVGSSLIRKLQTSTPMHALAMLLGFTPLGGDGGHKGKQKKKVHGAGLSAPGGLQASNISRTVCSAVFRVWAWTLPIFLTRRSLSTLRIWSKTSKPAVPWNLSGTRKGA